MTVTLTPDTEMRLRAYAENWPLTRSSFPTPC